MRQSFIPSLWELELAAAPEIGGNGNLAICQVAGHSGVSAAIPIEGHIDNTSHVNTNADVHKISRDESVGLPKRTAGVSQSIRIARRVHALISQQAIDEA